jgi:hypothetical protein
MTVLMVEPTREISSIMQSNPAIEVPAIKLDTTMMQKNLNVMLSSKLRYTPAAYLPSSHSP